MDRVVNSSNLNLNRVENTLLKGKIPPSIVLKLVHKQSTPSDKLIWRSIEAKNTSSALKDAGTTPVDTFPINSPVCVAVMVFFQRYFIAFTQHFLNLYIVIFFNLHTKYIFRHKSYCHHDSIQ